MMSTDRQNSASLLARLGAALYDLLLLFAILVVATLVWVLSGVQYGHRGYVLYVAFIYALIPLYYIVFWTYGGQTLGMKTWNIRVVDLDGCAIGWQRAALRMACAILSLIVFGLGFVYALFDKQGRTWHDILSKSRLLRVSA